MTWVVHVRNGIVNQVKAKALQPAGIFQHSDTGESIPTGVAGNWTSQIHSRGKNMIKPPQVLAKYGDVSACGVLRMVTAAETLNSSSPEIPKHPQPLMIWSSDQETMLYLSLN